MSSPRNSAIRNDSTCFQESCKLVERRTNEESATITELLKEESAAMFDDIIPCGTDSGGNEISPETYAAAQFPHDAKQCKDTLARIHERSDNKQTVAYLRWYQSRTGKPADMLAETDHDPESDVHYEHVAGPHCNAYRGYDSNAISAREVRCCNATQFIALYDDDEHHHSSQGWMPESDDENFKRKGKYHLTGLTDACAIYEDDCSVCLERHGCYEVNPFVFNSFEDGHTPFQPYCLETYRRISALRLGEADLSGVAE
jgi:hypothetical protein